MVGEYLCNTVTPMNKSKFALTREQDAWGHALLNYHLTGEGFEVIERDDGYIESNALAETIYFAGFDEWPSHERRALMHATGRVLDAGCGAGRVAGWLAERGCEVVGLDVSPLALKVARLRGVATTKLGSLFDIDSTWGRFDTVVMMGNNLALIGSPRKATALLKRLARLMPEDGKIIGSTMDPYRTKNEDHLAYHRRNAERGRPGGQLRIRVRHKSYATPWFDLWFMSEDELRDVAASAGWQARKVYRSGISYAVVLTR